MLKGIWLKLVPGLKGDQAVAFYMKRLCLFPIHAPMPLSRVGWWVAVEPSFVSQTDKTFQVTVVQHVLRSGESIPVMAEGNTLQEAQVNWAKTRALAEANDDSTVVARAEAADAARRAAAEKASLALSWGEAAAEVISALEAWAGDVNHPAPKEAFAKLGDTDRQKVLAAVAEQKWAPLIFEWAGQS